MPNKDGDGGKPDVLERLRAAKELRDRAEDELRTLAREMLGGMPAEDMAEILYYAYDEDELRELSQALEKKLEDGNE